MRSSSCPINAGLSSNTAAEFPANAGNAIEAAIKPNRHSVFIIDSLLARLSEHTVAWTFGSLSSGIAELFAPKYDPAAERRWVEELDLENLPRLDTRG